jgi:PIN domain nuclease of toxin-antitoxin system
VKTFLLDTHAFLWFVLDDPRLSGVARRSIEDSGNEVYLSLVSAWELAIKISVGKLTLSQPLEQFLPEQLGRNSLQMLAISTAHVYGVVDLPFYHRDPFDRLLCVQCLSESMALVSCDTILDAYGIHRIW